MTEIYILPSKFESANKIPFNKIKHFLIKH